MPPAAFSSFRASTATFEPTVPMSAVTNAPAFLDFKLFASFSSRTAGRRTTIFSQYDRAISASLLGHLRQFGVHDLVVVVAERAPHSPPGWDTRTGKSVRPGQPALARGA
jgi:hypothetical protein